MSEIYELNLKVIAALKILGVKAKINKEYSHSIDVGNVEALPNQDFYIRTQYLKKANTIEVNLSYSKDFKHNSLCTDKYQRICVNISSLKSAEQMAADIKRRVIESDQAKANEAYLVEVLTRNLKYDNDLQENKNFMSLSGMKFEDKKDYNDKNEASHWSLIPKTHHYMDIKVKANSELAYCELSLRGLSKEQWELILPIVNKIIKSKGKN